MKLNASYNFESFHEENNAFPLSAAKIIAKYPSTSYNPVTFYDGTEICKTHLINAIGNELMKNGYKIVLITAEDFTKSLANPKSSKKYFEKYIKVNAILIENIEYLIYRSWKRETFELIINILENNNIQFVYTYNRPSSEFDGIDKRIINTIKKGLIINVY
jgi:chromosomal replication initiator protein